MGTKFTQLNKILQQPPKLKHIGNLSINFYTDSRVTTAIDPEKAKPLNVNPLSGVRIGAGVCAYQHNIHLLLIQKS